MDKKYTAAATLVGTIIGAGFLGIPAAFSSVGFLPGLVMLAVVASLSMAINLYVGELVSEVEDVHQLTGFADMFLGRKGQIVMFISVLLGITGAIIAYTVAISNIGERFTGVSSGTIITVLTAVMTYFIWKGVEEVSNIEMVLVGSMVVFLIGLSVYMAPSIESENIARSDWANILSPYGVLFFALLGYSAIPEAEKVVDEDPKKLRHSIILAIVSATILYSIFAFAFVGVFGENVTEVATETLTGFLGIAGNLLAVLTMATSYLVLGLVMRDTYVDDFGMRKDRAVALTILPAFLVSFFMKPGFLSIIGLTGAVSGGLTGIIVCLMVLKMKEKRFDAVLYFLMAVFTAGIFQSIL